MARVALPLLVLLASPLGAQEDPVARGRHLVERATGCGECHTPLTDSGEPDARFHLAGHVAGRPVPSNTAFKEFHGDGVIYARNLTPDPDTGLGRWSREDFRRALTEGIGPTGRRLRPPMPWERFRKMLTERDVDAIWAYLRSLPPIRNPVPDAP